MKRIAALVLALGTLALAMVPDPGPEQIMRRRAPELTARLEAGEVQIEAGELLDLMHDRTVRLRIVDVRDEGAWNWFHLVDAERADGIAMLTWGANLEADEIVVVVDQDGTRAPDAWRLFQARDIRNSYLLAGGIDAWLDAFGAGFEADAALGDRHPAALPELPGDLNYVARVKRIGNTPAPSGGCG